MRTPSSTQPRNSGLDGIRAIAAGSVFVFHAWLYTRTPGTKPHWWDYTAIQFRTGLICFFVLSGYLLYRSFARAARAQAGPVSVGSYSARRVVRIIPAYYVAMLGALLLLGGAGDTPGVRLPPAEQWWLFPLFGQNFRGDTIMKLNPVTWTLCLEAMFYVLLPFLGIFAYRIAKGRWQPQVALMAGFVALGAIWNALVFDHGWGQVASKSLMAYMPYFAVGMLVAIWLVEREARGRTGPLSPRTTLWLALAGAVHHPHARVALGARPHERVRMLAGLRSQAPADVFEPGWKVVQPDGYIVAEGTRQFCGVNVARRMVAPEQQRPGAGVDEQAQRRDRSSL